MLITITILITILILISILILIIEVQSKSPNQHRVSLSHPQSPHEYQPLLTSSQQYDSQLLQQFNSQRVLLNPLPNRIYNPYSSTTQSINDTNFSDYQSAPGLLGIDTIKQMFGVDHSTPVLEVLRIAGIIIIIVIIIVIITVITFIVIIIIIIIITIVITITVLLLLLLSSSSFRYGYVICDYDKKINMSIKLPNYTMKCTL